jgi:hypothetical protein
MPSRSSRVPAPGLHGFRNRLSGVPETDFVLDSTQERVSTAKVEILLDVKHTIFSVTCSMYLRLFPVLIESSSARVSADISAPLSMEPTDITLKIREQGWRPYRARFDECELAWIVSVIDWPPQ